jgi:broad specificity phosphatase PhoE
MTPKAIHFIRHAQGYHNIDNDQTIPDPDLTPKGIKQCEQLAQTFPYFDRIDLVCASPIRRAIQTAQTSMAPFLQSGKKKILALPLAQEAPAEPANTPSGIKRLQEEYGDIVNFERCMELSDYDSKTGTFAPDNHSLEGRAQALRRFLTDRDEEEIVVVSHGQFLHYVSRDVDEEGRQLGGDWENTEFRSYVFEPVGHVDALLRETEESVRRRGASGPGHSMGSKEKEARGEEGV